MNQQTADWAKNIIDKQQKLNQASRDASWDQFGGAPGKNTNPAYYSNGTSTEAWKSQPGALTATRMKDPVLVNGLYYDRSYGKPAGQSQPSSNISQPSSNITQPRTAISGTMTYTRPLTRMQQAIQKGVSKGKISAPKNSAILNQMGYPSGGSAQTQQLNISSSQLQQLYNNLNRTSQSADFNGDGIMDNVSIVPGTSQVKVSFGGGGAYQY